MDVTKLSPSQLRKAADLKERIDALNSELSILLSGSDSARSNSSFSPQPSSLGRGGHRQMSAAGRARIAAAARARWAKARAGQGVSKSSSPSSNTGRRRMSPAARARIAAAAKARWARAKASGKNTL